MASLVEHILLLFTLQCFFFLLFFPAGDCILARFFPELRHPYRGAVAIGVSIFIYSVLLGIEVLIGLADPWRRLSLWGAVSTAAVFWIKSGLYRTLLRREIAVFAFLIFSYTAILSLFSSLPDGNFRRISIESTQRVLNLPSDNVIPYNFSRYITSRISPSVAGDIVPGWKAGDRGPLAGVVTAFVFTLLGFEDTSSWLQPEPKYAFVYQTLLCSLNLFVLIPAMIFVWKLAGGPAAFLFLFLVFSNWYCIQNFLFSWPKFFGAYFFLSAVLAFEAKLPRWLVGGFLALGVLSHDSLLFASLAFFGFLFLLRFRESGTWRTALFGLFPIFVAFFAVQIPWWITKSTVAEPSGRIFLSHVVCFRGVQLPNNVSVWSTLVAYVREVGWLSVIGVRLQNLFYPFSIWPVTKEIFLNLRDPAAVMNNIGTQTFFQFPWTVGPLLWAPIIMGFVRAPGLLLVGVSSLGALLFIAAISGCESNAVNHIWAYPLLPVLFGAAAISASKGTIWEAGAVLLGCAWNLLGTLIWLGFHSPLLPVAHITPELSRMLVTCMWMMVISLLVLFSREKAS